MDPCSWGKDMEILHLPQTELVDLSAILHIGILHTETMQNQGATFQR